MKKIYIQPSITVGSMNTFEMIAGGQSWNVNNGTWSGGGFDGPGWGKDGDGTGDDAPAAKHRGFYSSYGDEAEW